MKVSIHQPQYLPWLPYFSKIKESDLFILLDSVDFQKNGLQNRNQIKTPQGAHWLTVPVRQQLGQKIVDVKIDNSVDWRRKHWQTLSQCYGKAVAFETYKKDMQAWFEGEWASLSDLNAEVISTIMRWMGVRTPIIKSSQMTAGGSASELVLNLCHEVGATQYLSGLGGKNYLDEDAFRQAGIEIVYSPALLPTAYPQLSPKAGFINYLSVIDLLLNCGDSWTAYLPEVGRGA